MDSGTLDKTLRRMEREVLALKTAHQRGLGSYRFYQYEIIFENEEYATWRATVLDGEPTNPFVQATIFGVSAQLYFSVEAKLEDERTVRVGLTIGRGDTASGRIVVVSSSDLGGFSRV